MKIDQAPVVPVFNPVTLTFETLEELKEFVTYMGKGKDDEGMPYRTWNKLDEIARGYSQS